uniref:Uncharacterized protein n=1 Tax=Arundo donax TaxID=35708 RepID=A0A0A9BNV1_ARUDO
MMMYRLTYYAWKRVKDNETPFFHSNLLF